MTDLPSETVAEVERLTRLAREAVDEDETAAYRAERAVLLEEHGYTSRIREEDIGDVLVCHPAEWVEDGLIRPDRVEDTDRGVEVREEHGAVHGATVDALADFMGNHYGKPIADATPDELEEFREEYFPRNAWPTDDQRSLLEESVRLAVKNAGGRLPER